MSIFQLGDGSNPFSRRFSNDTVEEELDAEIDLNGFSEALDSLGVLETASLARALLSEPGAIAPPQIEVPLSPAAAPRPPSLPVDAPAPTRLSASDGTAAERQALNFTHETSLSVGGPYWGAELAWRRTTKASQERSASDEAGEDDETARSRKRRAAWRKYNETALERRLKRDL